MGNKNYKARVEISLIVEIDDILAVHKDNAAALAELYASDLAHEIISHANEYESFHVKNHGVKCIEAIEEEEE